MVPSTWLTVLLFLVFVAPGLVFDLLSGRRRAGASESAFREISRVVFAGTIFSGVALLVLSGLRARYQPGWIVDPGALLRDGSKYAIANYQAIAETLGAGFGISVGLVLAWHLTLDVFTKGSSIRQRSAWTQAIRFDPPKDHYAYARVRLEDGTIYAGKVRSFTPDIETSDREIALSQPHLKTRRKDSTNGLKSLPPEYQRIIIPGSAIAAVVISYLPKDTLPRWRRCVREIRVTISVAWVRVVEYLSF